MTANSLDANAYAEVNTNLKDMADSMKAFGAMMSKMTVQVEASMQKMTDSLNMASEAAKMLGDNLKKIGIPVGMGLTEIPKPSQDISKPYPPRSENPQSTNGEKSWWEKIFDGDNETVRFAELIALGDTVGKWLTGKSIVASILRVIGTVLAGIAEFIGTAALSTVAIVGGLVAAVLVGINALLGEPPADGKLPRQLFDGTNRSMKDMPKDPIYEKLRNNHTARKARTNAARSLEDITGIDEEQDWTQMFNANYFDYKFGPVLENMSSWFGEKFDQLKKNETSFGSPAHSFTAQQQSLHNIVGSPVSKSPYKITVEINNNSDNTDVNVFTPGDDGPFQFDVGTGKATPGY